MSESSSTTHKKRDREETTTTATTLLSSSPKRSRNSTLVFSQQHHIETLQTELDHERSLRLLDERRANQTQESLQRQLEFAVQQADRCKALLEQERTASETIVSSLKQKNQELRQELRQYQIELEEERGEHEELNDSLQEERVWEHKARHLQETLQASAATETALKQELQELQALLEQYQQQPKSTTSEFPLSSTTVEEAPPALLKELNRVRIQLAESERCGRQLQRRVQDLEQQTKTLIREREEAKIASQRLVRVDQQLQDLQKEYERVVAESKSWTDLKQSLAQQLQRQGLVSYKTSSDDDDGSAGGAGTAPEVATILRFMDQAQSRAEEMERQRNAQQEECQRNKTSLLQTKAELKAAHENMEQAAQERRDLESKLRASRKQVATLEAQQAIYQREMQSLRSLIQTFDDMPLASKTTQKEDVLASPKLNTSLKTVQVTLDSTRQELQLVKENRDSLSKELEESNKRQQEQHEELDRVREKFGKLKEALYAEREKAERAQERANQAESSAGVGSFNPETTRVLHMKETPLAEALKEEIKILKRQLEVAKGDKPAAKLAGTAAADPEKLNQRLKENFKEQIALFREGVYLMTGYKVDMLPGTDRPTFRVRSVFAEHEEDHLMLKWPKSEVVSSLDILNTDFAKELTTTPSYTYMTKFHSLPAFLASVQLSLFEKQTVLM